METKFLIFALFLSLCDFGFAFIPPKFSDYQRKDLAKAGVKKVVYLYEQTAHLKIKDTLSVRHFNNNGFLTALDSFARGKDTLYHLFLSQKITYSIGKNTTLLRIVEKKKPGDYFFQTLTVRRFNKLEKLIQEKVIIDNDTTIFDYKYDQVGNCIGKLGKCINRNKVIVYSYTYKYDGKNNILEEENWIDSTLNYSIIRKFNSSGQLTEYLEQHGAIEKYEYDQSGKKIRYARACPLTTDDESYGNSTGEMYTYGYDSNGRLSQINYAFIDCTPPSTTEMEYKENLNYLPSGLIASRCGEGGCYHYIYYKTN